jgi:hypothetical protein
MARIVDSTKKNLSDAAKAGFTRIMERAVQRLATIGIQKVPDLQQFVRDLPIPVDLLTVGADSIGGWLKVPNGAFGPGNESWVALFNKAVQVGTSGTGHAFTSVAELKEEIAQELGRMTTNPGSTDVGGKFLWLHQGVPHMSADDGSTWECPFLDSEASQWEHDHPAVKGQTRKGQPPTPDKPGRPFPAKKYRFEAAWGNCRPTCGCTRHLVAQPEWVKSEAPKAPQSFEETLTKRQVRVLGKLVDRAMAAGGKPRLYVQRASEEDSWKKVRLLPDLLNYALSETGVDEPSDDVYNRFVQRLDAIYRPSMANQVEDVENEVFGLAREGIGTVVRSVRVDGWKGAVRVARPVIDEVERVGGRAKSLFTTWLVLVLAGWVAIFFGTVFGHWETVAVASSGVGLLCLLGTLVPGAINGILNTARAFARALSKNVNLPAEEAMAGFTNLLLDLTAFVLIFGFLTVVVIKIGGSSETGTVRLMIWGVAALLIAKNAMYKRNKREDLRKRDSENSALLLSKVIPILLIGALGWTMWHEWNPTTVSTVAENGPFVVTSSVRWAIIWGVGLLVAISILGAKIKGDGGIAGIVRVLAAVGSVVCAIGLIVAWINWEGEKPTPPVAPTTQTVQTASASVQSIPPAPPMPAPPTASRTVKAQPAKATTTSAKPEMTVAEKKAAWCPNPRSKVLKDWCATH